MKGFFRDRLRHRIRRAGGPQARGYFGIDAGFAGRNGSCERVDPLVEARDAGHIKRDVGEVAGLAAQQGDNAFDGDLDIKRRPHFRARPDEA